MGKFSNILKSKLFIRGYNQNFKKGNIRKFDEEFFSQFEGMYFEGLPVYFLLSKMMAEGKCYDTSAILALALGKECFVCRGDLSSQAYNWGEDKLGHGWVEKDGYVYDTTWQIICKKEVYQKVFKPKNVSIEKSSEFLKRCKNITDWEIHDRDYYKNNDSLANVLAFQTRELAKLELKDPKINARDKAYWEKLIKDLPDEKDIGEADFEITKALVEKL